jgi:SAM-dependent methyltransferase
MRDLYRRFEKSLAENGVVVTLERVVTYTFRRLVALRPAARRTVRQRATSQHAFDEQHGIHTSMIKDVPRGDVVGDHWIGGRRHDAVPHDFDFESALAGLDSSFERYVFVDVGAGMGRALFLAAKLPFSRIIGVEYSMGLAAIARENLLNSTSRLVRGRDIEIVHADAVSYELPADPLVLFIYNPFTCAVMAEFIASVRRSFHERPRRIIVIYLTPVCGELWRKSEFAEYVRWSNGAEIFDTGPHLALDI